MKKFYLSIILVLALAFSAFGAAYNFPPVDTDATLSSDSDSKVPSQKAVKSYVDAEIDDLDLLTYTYYVKDAIPSPDGVTDNYAALQAFIDTVPDGATVEFEAGATYYLSNPVYIRSSNLNIRGNNCTINAPKGYIRGVLEPGGYAEYSSLSVSVTTGSNTFTIPAGVELVQDSLVIIWDNSEYAFPGYYNGWSARVIEIDGSTAKLSIPAQRTFTGTNIRKYITNNNIDISGFNIDMTGHPSGDHDGNGIAMYGCNLSVRNCNIIGNDYCDIGIIINFGENCTVENNFISGFLDTDQDEYPERYGDGVSVSGCNMTVKNNTIIDCKHSITGSNRKFISNNLVYENNTCINDPARYSEVVSNGEQTTPLFWGSLDIHANSENVKIQGNYVYSCNAMVYFRNGRLVLSDNTFHYADSVLGGYNAIISVMEEEIVDLAVIGNKIINDSGDSIPLIVQRDAVTSALEDVDIQKIHFSANEIPSTITLKGCTIVDNQLVKASVPTANTWSAGDYVKSSAVGVFGYQCTAGGTPGTWRTIGENSFISATAPDNPTEGMIWYQSMSGFRDLEWRYDGSAWHPVRSYGGMSLYVNSSTGTNSVNSGVFSTIQYAIDCIPPVYGGNVTINIASGTYNEQLNIYGKNAAGNYAIYIDGTLVEDEAATSDADCVTGTGATRGEIRDDGAFAGNTYTNYLALANSTDYRLIVSHTDDALTTIGTWSNTPSSEGYSVHHWGTKIDAQHAGSNITISNCNGPIYLRNLWLYDPKTYGVDMASASTLYLYRNKLENTSSSSTTGYLLYPGMGSTVYAYDTVFIPTAKSGYYSIRTAGSSRTYLYRCLFREHSGVQVSALLNAFIYIMQGTSILNHASTAQGTGVEATLGARVSFSQSESTGYNWVQYCTTGVSAATGATVIDTANNYYNSTNTADETAISASYGYID
jgi:hypothetical protein